MFTEVSEVLAVSIIRKMSPDDELHRPNDEGSNHL
jgi:hypothetical protein